jgi:hypothetical protein
MVWVGVVVGQTTNYPPGARAVTNTFSAIRWTNTNAVPLQILARDSALGYHLKTNYAPVLFGTGTPPLLNHSIISTQQAKTIVRTLAPGEFMEFRPPNTWTAGVFFTNSHNVRAAITNF